MQAGAEGRPGRVEPTRIMPVAAAVRPIPAICHQADPRTEGSSDWHWWLLRAHAGHEVSVADRLLDAGLPVLLPLCEYDRRSPNGTRRRTRRAIFDGYLFTCGDASTRFEVLSALAGRNAWTIPVVDVGRLVSDLSIIMSAIDAGMPVGRARPMVPNQTRVRVVHGPFDGYEGTFVRTGRRGLLLVAVAFAGQCVPVEVEDDQVEVVEELGA